MLMIAFTLIIDTEKKFPMFNGPPGLDKISWFKPVRLNDTSDCIVNVKSSRKSNSKPFGVTTILIEIFNQEKDLLADMTAVWFWKLHDSNK